MKIENFENFEINRFEGVDLSREALFNFIIEYKSYYDVANTEYVVKIKLWNGIELRAAENVESIEKMGESLNKINHSIAAEICMILHVIKKSKEYEKLSYTDIKEWAEEAKRYQERHKYKRFTGGTK